MRYLYFTLLAGFFLLGACSPQYTTFSSDLYHSYKWSDEDLQHIQFYLSDDLVISRNIDEEKGATIAGGEIKIVNGQKVEQIRFKNGTPGVFLFKPKDENFAISFEDKDDTHYLVFGPNPKYDGKYMLLATEWKNRQGKVTYAGNKFYTNSEVVPRLLVDLKRSGYSKTEIRTARGRKIE